jgi:hypothetical protein
LLFQSRPKPRTGMSAQFGALGSGVGDGVGVGGTGVGVGAGG